MILDRSQGREITNLTFNFFEDTNEKVWVGRRRKRFYGEMWENAVEGERHLKTCEILYA